MKNHLGRSRLERFETYVHKTETCWLWTGYIETVGYGRFYTPERMEWAHRAAYQFYVGPIPDGLFVCHTCDVRACVNPDHLFLGTNQENMLDAKAKGRTTAGERNPRAKLTAADVAVIRATYRRGGTVLQRHLAERFGVSRRAIGAVLSGQNWPEGDVTFLVDEDYPEQADPITAAKAAEDAWSYAKRVGVELSPDREPDEAWWQR